MNPELERIRSEMKQKRKKTNKGTEKKRNGFSIYRYLCKVLFVVFLTLLVLIFMKKDPQFKTDFYKFVYNSHFSFATFNDVYEKYMGNPLPFKDLLVQGTEPVFNEQLVYKETNIYKDGVELKVDKNYMVPALDSGIVVFIGDKDDYKNTVIVQQANGIDVWYSNVSADNLKLYDYIEKGSLIGEVKTDSLYMVFKKDGKVLDYKDYIQ